MSRCTRVVIAVAVLAAAVLTGASIAAAESCCAMGGAKVMEKQEDKKVETLGTHDAEVAALYAKYEGEFAAIHERHEKKIVELAEKTDALERQIDEIVKADRPDLGRLESRLKEISDLRFELTKLRFRMHKEARAVVEDADRAALDRHFAMGVGCCGGAGMQATYHPDRPTGKFDINACCPGGMPGCGAAKVDIRACCPGHEGHS